jgi:hypothetical protein
VFKVSPSVRSRASLTLLRSDAKRKTVALTVLVLAFGTFAIAATSASAITSDYCGYNPGSGNQCYEGSGYRGWRYHQASTGSGGPIVASICAYSWNGSAYRPGSGCTSSYNFYAFCNPSDSPNGNSSVLYVNNPGVTLYGHADSRVPC